MDQLEHHAHALDRVYKLLEQAPMPSEIATRRESVVRVERAIWKLGRNVLLEISPSGNQVAVVQNYFNASELRALADACMEAAAYLEANAT